MSRPLLLLAAGWGGLLVIGAATLPVYSDDSTLAAENGSGVLLGAAGLILVPLAILWLLDRSTGRRIDLPVLIAWVLGVAVALLALAGAATIGLFVAPGAFLILAALRLRRPPAARGVTG